MSNGRTSRQDYTNLLFTDSESDSRIPDLKLPAVKGKRQKKKRGGSIGYRPDETSCGLGSLMKVFLLLVLFSVVAVLGGISFWSMQKISSLQEKVDRLEQSDAFTPDSMTKFQTQLVSLNKSLTKLRSGAEGMKVSIEELKAKVKTFEDTRVDLNKAVESAKEVFDLPKKFTDLTTVVANMNATVTKKLESRLSALENDFKTSKRPDTQPGGVARPDGQYVEQLKQLNQTTSQSIASIKSRLDQEESKMSRMEEFINRSATASPMATSLINKMVEDTMQEVMANMTSPVSLPTGDLQGLLNQVNGMLQAMQQFKVSEENIVTKGEFLVFKDVVMDDLKNVNKSLASFNEEFEAVSSHFQLLDSNMKNISSFIQVGSEIAKNNETSVSDSGIDSAERLRHPEEEGEEIPSHPEEAGEETPSHPGEEGMSNHGEGDESLSHQDGEAMSSQTTSSPSTKKNIAGDFDETIPTEKNTDADVTEKPARDAGNDTSKGPESTTHGLSLDLQHKIKVDDITNMRELVEAFQKISPIMMPLDEEELKTLLNDSTVTKEQMKVIDQDSDGLFSVMEIAEVLKFSTPAGGSLM